ncbi:DUF2795 domain-containing protein [Amycolatopsis sp. K13G38]|uniref:DUF2795 domain-containing protein n=1 Tax=Amycolatopsis acididurans TaxID=2724524 RepID=A0ABX1JCF6_9PSEU|nr:DUF2795 domain-containing protein [Amycolatopsis acididurans]
MATTRERLRESLNDLDYPADKAEILACAEGNSADVDTLGALRAIPPDTYGSREELISAVRLVDEEGS